MSTIPVARPMPVGVLATNRGTTDPPPRPIKLPSWLRSAAVAVSFGVFVIASVGLTVAGFRPVSQNVVETDYLPCAEPASEMTYFSPTDVVNVEETSEYTEPGEARPSLTNPRSSLAAPVPVEAAKSEPVATTKRMKQSQTRQCGTAIDFVRSQSIAFDRAAREQKLVMVLHVAGNFEDPGFT